jgi:hypothetical protein
VFDANKVLKTNAQRLLKHELWRGQQRGGVGAPVHSRHIGSRCSLVPSAPSSNASTKPEVAAKDIALFVRKLVARTEDLC